MNEQNISLRALLEREFDRYDTPEAPVETPVEAEPAVVTETTVVTEAPVAPEAEWVVQLVKDHCGRCATRGFKDVADWIRFLVQSEAALETHPHEMIAHLAKTYGVPFTVRAPRTKVSDLFEARRKACACTAVDRFVEKAVTPEGACKYPHYADVREEMFRLMDCGAAHSVTDAYDQAIWLTATVRDRLIQERAEALLAERAREAAHSEAAGFCAVGKPCGETTEGVPSIRTLLERAFTKAGIYK